MLQRELDRAQELLDAKTSAAQAEKDRQVAAEKAVKELFTSNNPATDTIKATTNQKAIDDAQKLIDAVTDATVKAELQKDLDRAQELLDAKTSAAQAEKDRQAAAEKAVKELFTSNNPATDTIKATTNQKAIDDAQKLIDAVTDATVKAELQKDLDRAQELLDAKTSAAQAEKDRQVAAEKAVNELFKGNDPSSDAIKAATSQKEIDDAQKLVDKVTDQAKKAELQANLDKAQDLLDASLATSGTISPNEFAVGGDKYITGTYSGDVVKISMFQNGTEFKGAAMKDGEFSFYATDKKIKKTDEIIMVAYDKNGKEIARKLVKFVVITEGKLTPVEMTIPGHNNVTGTYTGDITKIELTVNGKTYKGGTVSNGTFKFYSLDKVTSETDVVVVKGYDSTGKLLDTQTVKIKSTAPSAGTITPAVMTIPGDKNVVGTYTGAVKSLVLTVDGVEYKGGTIANGEFKFYSFDKIKSATSEVTLKAYDKVGKLLDTQTVTFK
ncbi:immunoglobulin-like domain-containing protein [Listeria grandensis]|nr:immunoglobulin-like domain-containing protein [Listeria grandensis]